MSVQDFVKKGDEIRKRMMKLRGNQMAFSKEIVELARIENLEEREMNVQDLRPEQVRVFMEHEVNRVRKDMEKLLNKEFSKQLKGAKIVLGGC